MSDRDMITKLAVRISAALLPLSVGFLAVAITLLMLIDYSFPRFMVACAALIPGLVLLRVGMVVSHQSRFYFAATFLVLTGLLFLCIDLGLCPVRFSAVWPTLMLFTGMSFLSSGYLRHRKLEISYLVPAIAFTLLGFLFMLFSTRMVRVSFTTVVLWWSPIVFLPMCISLVIWLFRRRGGHEGE